MVTSQLQEYEHYPYRTEIPLSNFFSHSLLITKKNTCMHVIRTHKHTSVYDPSAMTQYTSVLVLYTPSVRMIEHWGYNCFQNLVQSWAIQVRSADGTRRSESETHWPQRTQRDTLVLCSPEINQSSHPHFKSCTSSSIDFTQITYLPHIIHLVMPPTYLHAYSVYMTYAHMSSSYFLCLTASVIRYHIIILTFKLKHKRPLPALV